MDLEAVLLLLITFTILNTAMRKPLMFTSLLIVLVFACNQHPEKSKNELLKPSALPSSFFTIDITRDTILNTAKGAIIKIPKDALVAEGPSKIQLEVKEAYTIREMIVAGLNTQSNGQPLSSGGMIYINAVGENTVRVEKAISVSIPTDWVNKDMQLFKGEIQSDSSINWLNPDTIPKSESEKYLEVGKTIFVDNCTRCHAIGKGLTGPDLAFVDRRLGQEGSASAFDFTSNSQKVLAEGDAYYNCLYDQYNKSPMPPFPQLTREEMTALYDYIENESYARGIPYPKDREACYDSCESYLREKEKLEKEKVDLAVDYLLPDATSREFVDTTTPNSTPWSDTIGNTQIEPPYYQFNIQSLGWFNIDILLKNNPDFVQSELSVVINGEYKTSISVYLVIPSIRAFLGGYPLKGQKNEYAFFPGDKIIPLPQNAEAYILSMGEANEKIVFSSKAFKTALSQQLELSLKEITKEEFDKAIRTLGLKDFSIEVESTADQQRIADSLARRIEDSLAAEDEKKKRELGEKISRIDRRIDSLRPKSEKCDCICAGVARQYTRPISDSSAAVEFLGRPAPAQ